MTVCNIYGWSWIALQASRLGLSVEEVQDALRVQIEGQQAGAMAIEGNRHAAIIIRAAESVRLSPTEFANVRITGKRALPVT